MDNSGNINEFAVGGVFSFEQYRDGKLIDTWHSSNIVVNEGLNHMLDTTLHGSTPATSWSIGLFEGNYTPLSTDTALNITANSTECIAYDETNRVSWIEAASAAQVVTNSASKAAFTINATKTIYGAFLISENTKSGTSGVLFCASKFDSSRAVIATDQLLVTYSVSATSV